MGGYKMPIPPKTRRFCVFCRRKTKWKYNPVTGHSECQECGAKFSKNPMGRRIRLYWCPHDCGRSVIAVKDVGTNYKYVCTRCGRVFKKEELI